MKKTNILKSRRFKMGTFATVITLVFLAVIIVLNLVVGALDSRFGLQLDLTPNSVYEIADATRDYLKTVDQNVEITVMVPEATMESYGGYYQQANEILKKFPQASSRVSLNYINLVQDPSFSAKYPELELSSSDILVTCGDKARKVAVVDLFNLQSNDYGQQYIASSKVDAVMVSAIMGVTSAEMPAVCFLTGFGDVTYTAFSDLLTANNFEVSEQNILVGEMDTSPDICILMAPTTDLDLDVLKKLDAYLENGGEKGKSLLYFPVASQPELPNLSAFLAEWGIQVEDGFMVETDSRRIFYSNPLVSTVEYAETEFSSTVLNSENVDFAVWQGKALTQLFENSGSTTVTTMLSYPSTALRIPSDADVASANSFADIGVEGDYAALIRATSTKYDGMNPRKSNVAVFSSVTSALSFSGSTSMSNDNYLVALLNDMVGRENTFSVPSKSLAGEQLNFNGLQALLFLGLFIIIIPMAILITGIVVWARRRHR
ncbi:MAG: GldG family protein [Oscillospiraceae bacterium]|nr:GldG family protein [Oscillospiraceae bacterium]